MPGFVDEARVVVRSGDGGNGTASFARGRNRQRGKPDGGDGGAGGSVVFVADRSLATLAVYAQRPHHRAAHGSSGGSNRKRGANADDLELAVPVGTVVVDATSGELLADLAGEGLRFVAAPGGHGGRGNASLTSPADRAPDFAQRGQPGVERELRLELRLVADVGFLGAPNAGKSTLLGTISRAHPTVAEYPFTTLIPVLGMVEEGGDRITVADLPGLIEGAADGRGLGTRFLRHAQRCAVLACVVDLAGDDPEGDLRAVAGEVVGYDPELEERMQVVVGTKLDLDAAVEEPARAWAAERGATFVAVSAHAGIGLDRLREVLVREVRRAIDERGVAPSFAVYRPVVADPIRIEREGDAYRVRSARVEQLVAMTPLANSRAVRHLQRRLAALGVEAALEREGAGEGDEVVIGEVRFEFMPERSGR